MNALSTRRIPCPTCRAEAGFPCTNVTAYGLATRVWSHPSRVMAAQAAREAVADEEAEGA